MDIPQFDAILQRAEDLKNKVVAAMGLSNHYSGAFRANPLTRIKLLVSCLDQMDRLLLMLSQVKSGAYESSASDAEQILWELVAAHERLADTTILESLEPIPIYIKKYQEFAQTQLESAKAELLAPEAMQIAESCP
ncbi:MAG TPA: hypothetical protein VKK79_17565 [Candidatus Lokiarchaeia archaeon]|nr:hypothetical protein [Candidatus Lokiarchaeia archaeon]